RPRDWLLPRDEGCAPRSRHEPPQSRPAREAQRGYDLPSRTVRGRASGGVGSQTTTQSADQGKIAVAYSPIHRSETLTRAGQIPNRTSKPEPLEEAPRLVRSPLLPVRIEVAPVPLPGERVRGLDRLRVTTRQRVPSRPRVDSSIVFENQHRCAG